MSRQKTSSFLFNHCWHRTFPPAEIPLLRLNSCTRMWNFANITHYQWHSLVELELINSFIMGHIHEWLSIDLKYLIANLWGSDQWLISLNRRLTRLTYDKPCAICHTAFVNARHIDSKSVLNSTSNHQSQRLTRLYYKLQQSNSVRARIFQSHSTSIFNEKPNRFKGRTVLSVPTFVLQSHKAVTLVDHVDPSMSMFDVTAETAATQSLAMIWKYHWNLAVQSHEVTSVRAPSSWFGEMISRSVHISFLWEFVVFLVLSRGYLFCFRSWQRSPDTYIT